MWAGVGDIVGKTIAVLRRMTAFNPRFLHLPTQHAVRIAAMFLVWCILFGWHLIAPWLGCLASAVVLALAAGLLMSSGTEVAFSRRRVFVSHYLETGGLLFRLLSRRTLILITQGVKALALGLFLLVSVLRLDQTQWLLLLADVLVIAFLLTGFFSILSGEVRNELRGPMVRHWAARVNATLLWLSLVLLMFFSPQVNYSHLRWEEVLAFSAAQPAVGCNSIAVLARFAAVGEALGLWSTQHLFADLRQPAQVFTAWGRGLPCRLRSLLSPRLGL